MQHHSSNQAPAGEGMLAIGILLAGLGAGAWFLWFRFHGPIASAVMSFEVLQLDLFGHLTDRYADLREQVLSSDPASVAFRQLVGLMANVSRFYLWPVLALMLVLSAMCFLRAAPGRFTRNIQLPGLIKENGISFPFVNAFTGRELKLVAPATGEPRPADPALHAKEWLDRFGRDEDGGLSEGRIEKALAAQLGAPWQGVLKAPPHVRCLFAVFALHAARRRDEARYLLGLMAAGLPTGKGEPAGPAASLAFASDVVAQADKWLKDRELIDPAAEKADAHGFTNPALMSLLQHARRRAGVLAPAQFAFLKLVDRSLWYALHSLGFPKVDGVLWQNQPNPRVEAIGSRGHWVAECMLGRPLARPYLAEALRLLKAPVSAGPLPKG